MNVEIGSTLVNGYALNKTLSVVYEDLREKIDGNSIARKYVFADVSDLTPEYNVLKNYPLTSFRTFSNVAEVNIRNVAVVPATFYDVKCAGIVTLIDVSTMKLQSLGMIKSTTTTEAEILWLEYISESKQILSDDVGNLITIGSDGKLFLNKDVVERTENKTHYVDNEVDIVKIFDTYLDYNPAEIKKLPNVRDGAHVVIVKDQLHNNKSWLYVLSSTNATPVITSVGEYTKTEQYPSMIAVKSYVDSVVLDHKKFDEDTIIRDNNDIWKVALDKHTITKNNNGLYSVNLDVLREELLKVESEEGNVAIFNENGYISDIGYGITEENESIDDGTKKLVTKKFLHSQQITEDETTDLINSVEIKVK